MRIRSGRGGVILDVVVALGLLVLAAFALSHIGITLPDLIHGVQRFLGR
jgi:hypothetical protein